MDILAFLREDSPYSTMRVCVFLFTLLFVPAFVLDWTWAGLSSNSVPDVPAGVIWLLGVVLGAKTAQKFVETR